MLSFFPALLIRRGKVEVLGGFFLPGERGPQGSHKPLQPQRQLPPCPLPSLPELPARPWVSWLPQIPMPLPLLTPLLEIFTERHNLNITYRNI